MILGGLGRWWVVTLDHRTILVSVKGIWVVLGLGRWLVVMFDRRATMVSLQGVWVVLGD